MKSNKTTPIISSSKMLHGMSRSFCQFEIFYSIIRGFMIKMMDDFVTRKITSHLLFHYKTVFKNISGGRGERMIWKSALDISAAINTPAFPISISRTVIKIIETFFGAKTVLATFIQSLWLVEYRLTSCTYMSDKCHLFIITDCVDTVNL